MAAKITKEPNPPKLFLMSIFALLELCTTVEVIVLIAKLNLFAQPDK